MNQQNPPKRLPETEFDGEIFVFSGPLLSPDDPTLEPRVRKARPIDKRKPEDADKGDAPANE